MIAYALAGKIDIDFEREPLGNTNEGIPIYLSDIWPSREEIQSVEKEFVIPGIPKIFFI